MTTSAASQTHTVTSTFTVADWTETPVYAADSETVQISGADYPARGFNRADVTYTYSGDITGTGKLVYLLVYNFAGHSPSVGYEAFTGIIDGHEGSLVFSHNGYHDESSVHDRLGILPGLGTGGLAGMRGHADVEISGHQDGYQLTLQYWME